MADSSLELIEVTLVFLKLTADQYMDYHLIAGSCTSQTIRTKQKFGVQSMLAVR